jgi:hypothetical protein
MRLKFGSDCLQSSGHRLRKLEKNSEQKKQAERRGDATPVGVEVSISRSDSAWLSRRLFLTKRRNVVVHVVVERVAPDILRPTIIECDNLETLLAGNPAELHYHLVDEMTGAPVKDLKSNRGRSLKARAIVSCVIVQPS